MKLRVRDHVICQVETRNNGSRAILSRTLDETIPTPNLESKEFEIIAIQPAYPDADINLYTIAVDDGMVGWIVGEFHIHHLKIDPKFKDRKFWDLYEEFMKPVEKK